MSDETTPAVATNEADGDPESTIHDPTIIAKLRDEIRQLKADRADLRAKWKDAEPVLAQYQQQQESQKTEAQKAAERVAQLERELAERDSAIARTQREAAAVRLATKAGIDPDIVGLLDLSKIDLDDEKAALETLGKFAAATRAPSASNPGRTGPARESDQELRARYFGGAGNRPTIFGG